jgi:hypothetical protein
MDIDLKDLNLLNTDYLLDGDLKEVNDMKDEHEDGN